MLKQDRKSFIPPRNNNDLTGTLEKLIFGKKVSIFIDAANLYHSSSVARLKIDFIQVIKWFKTHCKLKNANFYTAYDIEDQKQMEFLQDLEYNGYKMIKKPLKIFENSKKGNMDIEIAVDCLIQQNLYDIIILISGDGDFSYLMQTLERLGKQTVVIGVGGFTSYELHQEVNEYFFFNRIRSVWQTQRTNGEKIPSSKPSVLIPKSTDPNSEMQNVQKSVYLKKNDNQNTDSAIKKQPKLKDDKKPIIKKPSAKSSSTPTIHL
jgi:uncharacterized LabA/DUF88 family protein